MGQRLGAAHGPVLLKVAALLLAAYLVAAPAWLPIAAHRLGSGRTLSAAARARVASATRIVSAAACLLGAGFLLGRALG